MVEKNLSEPFEIYDMSVNNPMAQGFLEKSAFLKFLIQQIKALLNDAGEVKGSIQKYNSFVNQIERVRNELLKEKDQIKQNVENFKVKMEEINKRRRNISQQIMQLTRGKTEGQIDQDSYHRQKYELEMKRKSLGNQIHIMNKNISIYNSLMNSPISTEQFEHVTEEMAAVRGQADEGLHALEDEDLIFDDSADGITYMGVLDSDIGTVKKNLKIEGDPSGAAQEEPVTPQGEDRLNIITETGKQYYYSLSVDKIVRIGRSSQNDIQIPSPAVSRNHAEIRYEQGDFYINDLESSNGTFVNDKMVIRRKIVPNDTISIGGTRLIYLIQ
ncbi:FHA domain-containing protein [candidate division CSSED10-310 bacterium]|uniref:FHA domain-containing protein n=1 Tax=candidate division CSSED10-310 bacterium TaxID=2855610 RepID=A0ABV6YRG3_UNCC1